MLGYLATTNIESKDAVDASYAKYLEATKAVTPAELKTFLDKVTAEETKPTGPPAEGSTDPTVNYTQFTAEAEALLTKAGQGFADKALYTGEDGTLDEGAYTADNIGRLRTIQTSQTAGAIDALAAAYKYLDIQLNPLGLGSGPFKFVEYKTGESLEFDNNPDYFGGASEISKVFVPIIKDDIAGGQALAAGQVDWKYSIEGGTYAEIKDNPELKFVEYPDFGFFGLYFNLRDGQLFADKNLRQAVSYCFDKEATAKAATDDLGVAIYSEIPPASWAYPTTGLNTYPMDPAKSKELIEASGWKLGSDGIYEKDGKKLATTVAVRAGRPNRSKWMQLMADQVKACGIDIQFKEVDFGAILNMLTIYPHINAAAPESGKPFDAYFGGFGTGLDPDPFSLYHSSECSTAERPDTNNYICYKNPEVDKLIEDGLKTFDVAERTKIYQEYAMIQSNDLPVIYSWSDIAHEGLRNDGRYDRRGRLPDGQPPVLLGSPEDDQQEVADARPAPSVSSPGHLSAAAAPRRGARRPCTLRSFGSIGTGAATAHGHLRAPPDHPVHPDPVRGVHPDLPDRPAGARQPDRPLPQPPGVTGAARGDPAALRPGQAAPRAVRPLDHRVRPGLATGRVGLQLRRRPAGPGQHRESGSRDPPVDDECA